MIEKGLDIVVKGPCYVKVKQGKIDVAGIEINEEINLNENKTYTLTTLSEAEIETNCEILAKYNTLGWRDIAEKINGKIVVLGATDSGKSYFSNLVSNVHKLKILDSDVGQSSLFIPTFIALSKIKQSLSTQEKGVEELEFFGSIQPASNPQYHILLIDKLAQKNENLVIDTDGWVSGFLAYRHKLELIYRIDPDYIITFENEKLYLPSDLKKKNIIIKNLPIKIKRNRETRRNYRKMLYREYFKEAKEKTISSDLLLGFPITDTLFISWGKPIQLIEEEPCEGYYGILEGMLVGLTKSGKVIGAGIITKINKDYVTIKTPVNDFDGVLLSKIGLNQNYEEIRIEIKKCT